MKIKTMAKKTSKNTQNSAPEKQEPAKEQTPNNFAELRKRLWVCLLFFMLSMGGCYYFIEDIFNILILPLNNAMESVGGTKRLIFTNLTEGFVVYLKLAAFGAMFLSFPVWLNQLWCFVSPGLYKKERKSLRPFLIYSPILFIAGALFVYFLIIPLAWEFLLNFQTNQTAMPIEMEAKISEYLALITTLIIVFGASFQLPVVLVMMMKLGIIDVSALVKVRKIVIVGIFIVAAFVTPPDVISQISLAIPLLLMFEIAIVIGKRGKKNV